MCIRDSPSPTPHFVPENTVDGERISLAFNTWPEGPFGSEKDLTYGY